MFKQFCLLTTALIIVSTGLMAGCGSDKKHANNVPATLQGTVAIGKPLVGNIYIKSADGAVQTVELQASDKGQYSIDVEGMALPLLIAAQDSGETITIYSIAYRYGTANVTPMTNLILALASGKNPADLFNITDVKGTAPLSEIDSINEIDLQRAKKSVKDLFVDAMPLLKDFDPLTDGFTATSQGFDKLLDMVRMEVTTVTKPTPTGPVEELACGLTIGGSSFTVTTLEDLESKLDTIKEILNALDFIPPVLQSVAVTPTSYDFVTNPAPVTVTASVSATDDVNLATVSIVLASPTLLADGTGDSKTIDLVWDAAEKKYLGTLVCADDLEKGRWKVGKIILSDASGNTAIYTITDNSQTKYLIDNGLLDLPASTISVCGIDLLPLPVAGEISLVSVSIQPTGTINVASQDVDVTVTVRTAGKPVKVWVACHNFMDNQAVVTNPMPAAPQFRAAAVDVPDEEGPSMFKLQELTKTADNTFTGTITMKKTDYNGTWLIGQISLVEGSSAVFYEAQPQENQDPGLPLSYQKMQCPDEGDQPEEGDENQTIEIHEPGSEDLIDEPCTYEATGIAAVSFVLAGGIEKETPLPPPSCDYTMTGMTSDAAETIDVSETNVEVSVMVLTTGNPEEVEVAFSIAGGEVEEVGPPAENGPKLKLTRQASDPNVFTGKLTITNADMNGTWIADSVILTGAQQEQTPACAVIYAVMPDQEDPPQPVYGTDGVVTTITAIAFEVTGGISE